jgi:iron(III) transport system ATP-binding protein
MNQPAILQLHHVSKQFSPYQHAVVADISLTLYLGEILGFLGPSGCGKTTLLRLVAGFEQPSEGTIELRGQKVSGAGVWLPPEQRQTGMVFQDYALFPHLTVAQNIAFGLRQHQKYDSRRAIKERVSEVLALIQLTGYEKRYPHELSGGQQQRVALARALAPQPTLILLDEPLSNLDVQVRLQLRQEVRYILKQTGTSAIFVTHDQEEALAVSDKIAVMRKGKIEQLGTPEEIYTQPASRFVAQFVAQANFLPARRRGEYWETEIGKFAGITTTSSVEDEGELMLREEDVQLFPDETAIAVVKERQFVGREYRYFIELPSGQQLTACTATEVQIPTGTRVRIGSQIQSLRIFPKRREEYKSLAVAASSNE